MTFTLFPLPKWKGLIHIRNEMQLGEGLSLHRLLDGLAKVKFCPFQQFWKRPTANSETKRATSPRKSTFDSPFTDLSGHCPQI